MKKTVFAIKLRSHNKVADIVAFVKILLLVATVIAAIGALQVYVCQRGTWVECLTGGVKENPRQK